MKKHFICAAILSTLGVVASTSALAANVNNGDILRITSATFNSDGLVTGGSYFGMDATPPYSNIAAFERGGLSEGTTGLVIGTTTLPGTFHTGSPLPGETGPIVASWGYFSSTGTNYLTVPVTGSTTAGLDLSGWNVAWNNVPAIDMGAGAWQPANCAVIGCTGYTFTDGKARFQWDGIYGNAYTLDYTAMVPQDGKTSFGGVQYYLHLEGIVQQAVPVPAAFWLFGSGLIGLMGFARSKKI